MKSSLTRAAFLIFFLFVIWHANSAAVSLKPEVAEKLRKEGRLQEWIDRWESAAQRGMYEQSPQQIAKLAKRGFTGVDTLRPLVLCVDFSDNEHSKDTSEFSWLLFSKDFTVPTGSFRDYYLENSYGKHDPQGAVYGWVTVDSSYDYYTAGTNGTGSYPRNSQGLVEDVLDLVDPYVNFADYDFDGDLWIDGLMVVHAGPGAEETGDDWDIWSHRWQLPSIQWRDGVQILYYTVQPEVHEGGALIDIGVFCHEWGHFLGITWEEYDTDYTTDGLGYWSVMALGCYNNNGATPAHHSAYCKYFLGWSEVSMLASNQTGVEIIQAETSPVSYRLWTSGGGGNQYFMVENRQKTGFDFNLPGSGLLIYDVDIGQSENNSEWCPGDDPSPHLRTAIEQADGLWELENCPGYSTPDRGDANDPFPGFLVKRAFDDTTTPSSRDYSDNTTQVAVWNISDSDSVMYANLDVTWSRPNLAIDTFYFDDNAQGDGDGRPEPGETVKLYFAVSNAWKTLAAASAVASADTAGIDFSDSLANLGDIVSGGSANNYGDAIEFTVAPGFPTRKVDFTLHLCGDGGSYCVDLVHQADVGPTEILLVDDDNFTSGDSNCISYYQVALDSLGEVYDIWDKQAKAAPSADLSAYSILIWFTGDNRDSIFSTDDLLDLMSFLNGGGKLFLTSQDAVELLAGSADPEAQTFLSDYLHVGYGGYFDKFLVAGEPGDEIGDGMYIFPLQAPGADNQTSKDILLPGPEAEVVLGYRLTGWALTDSVAAAKYHNDIFRLVVFGFGLEAINPEMNEFSGQNLSKPRLVMQRVLNWLRGYSDVEESEYESANLPKMLKLGQNYPNPFNPATSIQYTVDSRQKALRTTLKIYNIKGQLVKTLVDEETIPGTRSVVWDGKDRKGNEVSSGIYFYRLRAGDQSEVRKMVLLK